MKRRISRIESCISKHLIGILIFVGILNMLFLISVKTYAEEYGGLVFAAENAQVQDLEVSDPAPVPEVTEPALAPEEPESAPAPEVSEPTPAPEVSEPTPSPETPDTEPALTTQDKSSSELGAESAKLFTEQKLTDSRSGTIQTSAEREIPDNGIPVVIILIDESEGNNTIDDMNASLDHSVDCVGSMQIIIPQDFQYSDIDTPLMNLDVDLDYIRGRGNYTWTLEKKPYKVKLGTAENVLGLGENRHWVLLANASDKTVIKNRLTGWLGDEIGLEYTPNGVPVDVVMIGMKNGEEVSRVNLGSYLLAEHLRVDKNRLNIGELKKKDTESEDITGGYLIQYGTQTEADDPDRFVTDRGLVLANHTPTFDPEDEDYTNEQQKEYIRNHIQMVEDAIYGADYRDDNGIRYTDYMDMESAAKYWLIQEISNNTDGFSSGSTYFYKKADTFDESGNLSELGKVYWGPLWDFDYAWGDNATGPRTEGFKSASYTWIAAMLYDDSETGFRRTVQALWPSVRDQVMSAIEDGGILDQYYQETADSYKDDYEIWKDIMPYEYEGRDDYLQNIAVLKEWIINRVSWLDGHMSDESADGQPTLDNAVCRVQYMVDDTVLYQDYYLRDWSFTTESVEEKFKDALEKEGFVFLGWTDQNGNSISGWAQVPDDLILVANYISDEEASRADEIIFRSDEEWISSKYAQETDYLSNYTVLPGDAQDKSLTWKSSDETIAVVDQTGKVHIFGNGTVTITATLKSGACSSYTLIVTDDEQPPLKELILDPESVELNIGDHKRVEYKILPYLSKYSSVYFYSEDPEIAEGDGNGVVFGRQAGSTRLCVMAAYYGDNGENSMLAEYLIVNVVDPSVPEEPSEGNEGTPVPEEIDEEKPTAVEPAAPVDDMPDRKDTNSGNAAMREEEVRPVPVWNVEISADETIDMLREALLSQNDQLDAAQGKKISFTIEYLDGEDKVPGEDKAAVNKAIGSGILVKWLDISLYKQIEGSEKVKVEHAYHKVKLQIKAPDDILSLAASGIAFEVISVVDGQVIRIPAYYNPETHTIDFETDVFGVFALVYYA